MASLHIAIETFVLLRRHKIFVPLIAGFVLICLVATAASGLAQEDFSRVIFDVGILGFHMMGGLVAIFWGAKSLTDSRQEGSLEVQLASPMSRSSWLFGKYLGIAGALIVLAVIFFILWQGVMAFFNFGLMTFEQSMAVGLIAMVWLILAALVVLFSSFCNLPVAVFSCLILWALGMTSGFLTRGLPADLPGPLKVLAGSLGKYWNLQYFNLADLIYQPGEFPSPSALLWRFGHGVSLVALILILASVIFSRRDLVR